MTGAVRRLLGLSLVLAAGWPDSGRAANRALLIGIDQYAMSPNGTVSAPATGPSTPLADRGWSDLEGAVNDVTAVAEILVSRYGFHRQEVHLLTNEQASRQAILQAFEAHLVRPTKKGDVCFFYYAGHGSQEANPHCPEQDCSDETVVPADANRGARDIRDKEWSRLLNDVIDRGALLTVFFDSCHSGSISRGLASPVKWRFLPPDPRGSSGQEPRNDDPRGLPAERGALVFSAAQEFQRAEEVVDGQGVPHGAFSLAVLKTLRTMPTDESAENVFRRVRAFMHANGTQQEPVLAGTPERIAGQLLGGEARANETRVAVRSVSPDGIYAIQGGVALGLCVGSEFRRVEGSSSSPGARAPVRLRIEQVEGLNRSFARIIQGSPADIAVGDLVAPDRWMGCDEPFLRVWSPPATLSHGQVRQIVRDLSPLRQSRAVRWIEDPTEESPTHVLSWDGRTWQLSGARSGKPEDVGSNPTPTTLLGRLHVSGEKPPRLYLHLPPPVELATRFEFAPQNASSPVEQAADRSRAQYLLASRVKDDTLEYAWVLPNATRDDARPRSPLPVRTDWVALGDSLPGWHSSAAHLQEVATRLGKSRMWLQLESPPDEGEFPYRLVLRNRDTGRVEKRSIVYDGESFDFALQADPRALRRQPVPRFVYVFVIDSHAKMTPLFPRWANEGNHLPQERADGGDPATWIPLEGWTATVRPPYGIDTYFVLTTREPLPDISILRGEPVRRESGTRETPLSKLLSDITAGTRGRNATPTDWSLERVVIRSAPRPKP